ncbi:MAG: WXG100 family type VII secretion target, partial [Chloroflexota bacterium]
MAEDILQIDYSQIDLIAAHFNTQAETVDQLLANLNQQVSSVRDGGWLGEAAEAFFSEYQDLVEPGIVRLSEALSEGNRITLQMSALLQNAEEEAAAQIAFEGSSGIGDTFNQAQLVLANGYETAMEMVEEFGQNRVVDAFRAGYSHQIPRDMVDHYAYGNGAPLHFNEDQMAQLAVDADISQSDEFQKVINEIAAKGGGTQKIGLTVLSEADTDGTLGNFHID